MRVIQEGKEPGQGVGFLDDGTMIVVEGGARLYREGPGRLRHARPPDGRRADDLRPAAPRLTSRREGADAPADAMADAAVDAMADAVVVAAGASSRMGGIDKLAALVHDRPLLAWSLDAIAAAPAVDRIVVVVASTA